MGDHADDLEFEEIHRSLGSDYLRVLGYQPTSNRKERLKMTTLTNGQLSRARRVGGAMPPRRIDLNGSIAKSTGDLPPRIIIHGAGGMGKTSLASHFKNPIFVLSPGETGLLTLQDNGLVDPSIPHFQFDDGNGGVTHSCSIWEEALSAVDALTTQDHDYKTVVFDVMNGFEKLCQEYVCEKHFGGNWGIEEKKGFDSYGAGYKVTLPEWTQFIQLLGNLRDRRRMTVVGLCHTGVSLFKNPEGPDYDRYVPDMHDRAWKYLSGQFDIVLFLHRYVAAEKERGTSKAKGKGGIERLIEVETTAAWDAKNRHGMSDPISMGNSSEEAWKNLVSAMTQAKKEAIARQKSKEGTAS